MTGRFAPRVAAWPLDPVLRKLKSLAPLSEAEEAFVRNLGSRRERYRPGEELIPEGAAAVRPRMIVAGWAARQRVLPDGRRQIFGFLLPGDAVGLSDRPSAPALAGVVAVTAMETIDFEPAMEAVRSGADGGLLRAVSAIRVQEQQLLLDHMVRLGQQTAYERVGHFLLELQRRLQVAGLGDAQRFPLPLTQEILADALGLSIVHVNRILQQLRREGLLELRSGVAILLQPQVLAGICDYDGAGSRLAAHG